VTVPDGTQAESDSSELIADRYRLISEVGRGAMGVVWRARDERLGRTVAVKELRAGVGLSATQVQDSYLRARREARIAARLQHPNAVAVFDVAEHEERPYLVMEYVPSLSLAEVLRERGSLPAGEVAEIGEQLASALIAAHETGIVHRDIKPGNILLTEAGTAKVTDFGISRAVGDVTVTATGEMLGTPAYLAPEVAQGRQATAASDVFSLGATLYAAAEGEPPFGTGPTAMALLLRIVNGEIKPPRNIGRLTGTVMWMLRNDPLDRPDMAAVRRSLHEIAILPRTDEGTVPIRASMSERGARPSVLDAPPPLDPEDEQAAEAGAEAPAASGSGPDSGSGSGSDSDSGSGSGSGSGSEGSDGAGEANGAGKGRKTSGGSNGVLAASGPTTVLPRSRRQLLLVALLVAVVLVGGVVAGLVASSGSGTPTPTGGPAGSSSAAPKTTAKSAGATSAGGHATTPVASQTSASPAASTASPAAGDTASQMTAMIAHYYQLVPGDLDQAWNYMTADYQQNHAGGPSGYRQFWGTVQSVSVSNIDAQPPSTVVATIDYTYKNGQRVQERTSFGLVYSGGMWKIASSSVLSSGSF
jgi:serine/threonine protein kinase